jgi:hypothetical protein
MDSTIENTETALMVYTKFSGDVSRAVQKTTSLSEIRPENRIVVEGGMYIASATNLALETAGFTGFLFLEFYQEVKKDAENTAPKSLSMLVMDKFFKKEKDKPDIVHEGREYRSVWRIWSDTGTIGHWIILNGDTYGGAIGKMKVRLIERKKLLLSNDFLNALYSPVLNALLDVHTTLGRF